MVQIVAALGFLEKIVVTLMGSMTSHELPAVVHLKHVVLARFYQL